MNTTPRRSTSFFFTMLAAILWSEAACVPPARGALVRVAEGACEALVELVDAEGSIERICPVAADLVVIVAELTLAEKERRDAVVRIATSDGKERTVVVPAEHLGRAMGSTQRALRAVKPGQSSQPQ